MWLKTLERVTVFFIRETYTEVEVQFEDEKPTWIPLETSIGNTKVLVNHK